MLTNYQRNTNMDKISNKTDEEAAMARVPPQPTGSAVWRKYSETPEKWALLLHPEDEIRHAVALVKQTADGEWFAEHRPWMGQWTVLADFDAAKAWAGHCWRGLWQNAKDTREATQTPKSKE